MDLSPRLLTDVQFREQWRGYKPEEVDEFLERVAAGIGELQQRLAEAMQRATTAEKRLLDRSDEDEIRRTLVLAQRTADASVAEARAEADRLVSETDARCRALVAEAEAQAAELEADITMRRRVELGALAEERSALEHDIESLRAFVDQERARLTELLSGQIDSLRRSYTLPEPPAVSGVDPLPSAPEGDVEMRAQPFVDAPPSHAPAPPAPPEVAALPEPEPDSDVHDLHSAREGLAEAMRRAGLEELIAEDEAGSRPELFDDRAGDITGEFDSLTELAQPLSLDDDDLEQPLWREDPDQDDDPFLAELRRAVGDTEPLGPRDHVDPPPGVDPADEDDAAGGFLRRRRRD